MKNIIFVIPTLGNGGAEKSLLAVLQNIDYSEYNVDIFSLRPTGLIADMIPDKVNVLPLSDSFTNFKLPLGQSVKRDIKKLKFCQAYNRIMYSVVLRKYNMTNRAEQYAFKYLKRFIGNNFKHYDAGIGYLEKTSNYIVSEVIDADVKIGYIHSDYNKLQMDKCMDEDLMRGLNYLVTVSDTCAEILKEALPGFSEKVRVIENIIDKNKLMMQAREENPFDDNFNGTRIVTVGRVSHEKGPDIALEACRILVACGCKIKWHMIGAVDDLSIKEKIKAYCLEEIFFLEGLHKNPYKYVFNSDIYVQPSRYEGKSIAIEEAKVLEIPIVTTGFTTAFSQISEGLTGLIADEISGQALASAIKRLINDHELYCRLKENLKEESGNTDELKKLTALIEDRK